MPDPMIIADYDPRWPAMFEAERARILGALKEKLVALEHIGSTAVPGLAAKPIIDMLALVRDMSVADECIESLKRLGYAYDPYPAFPERRFFRDGPMGDGPHHLHMTYLGSDFGTEKLVFRDYLRAHPDAARQYEDLKRELVVKYGQDRERYEQYTEAKTAFVQSVLRKARESDPRRTAAQQ